MMVKSMDPDAPRRQRLPLHDQDAQVRYVFQKKLSYSHKQAW